VEAVGAWDWEGGWLDLGGEELEGTGAAFGLAILF
jgi:hypothetical protein